MNVKVSMWILPELAKKINLCTGCLFLMILVKLMKVLKDKGPFYIQLGSS